MPTDDASTLATPALIAELERVSKEVRTQFVDGISQHLAADPKRASALARMLQIYAVRRRKLVPRGMTVGKTKLRNDGASWTQAYQDLKQFQLALRPELELPQLAIHPSPDTFRSFLLGNSEAVEDIGRLRLLGLFLTHIMTVYPELAGEIRMTREDTDLLSLLRDAWDWLRHDPEPGKGPISEYMAITSSRGSAPIVDEDVEVMRQYISRFFDFPTERREQLRQFVERWKSGSNGHAHFICYRPQLATPNRLIKSFLVIIPPGGDVSRSGLKRNYTFSHFYKHDPRTDELRRSVGIVMPMAGGLYFVGGQAADPYHRTSGPSYRTLKIIVVPWVAIDFNRNIMPALVMSSNRAERHIVSRFALRRTALTHHTEVGIGGINLPAIGDDLERLVRLETKAPIATAAVPGTHVATTPSSEPNRRSQEIELEAQEILKVVNNTALFDLSECALSDSGTPIGRPGVEDRLNGAFREPTRIVNKAGDVITWNDLRFAALDTRL